MVKPSQAEVGIRLLSYGIHKREKELVLSEDILKEFGQSLLAQTVKPLQAAVLIKLLKFGKLCNENGEMGRWGEIF